VILRVGYNFASTYMYKFVEKKCFIVCIIPEFDIYGPVRVKTCP